MEWLVNPPADQPVMTQTALSVDTSDELIRPAFLLKTETLQLLCGNSNTITVVIDEADFEKTEVWRLIRSLYSISVVTAARWWRQHHQHRSPLGIMQSFGLADHHKSHSDWNEMSTLSDSSAYMSQTYDLPLNTLRLWSRLSPDQQSTWKHIFALRQVKKNLIREIITDFYDLDEATKTECLNEALEIAENWQGRSSVFPAHELRDFVHRRRYPRLTTLAQELYQIRKELNAPKNISIELPADLESGYTQIRADLRNPADIQSLLDFLSDEKRQKQLTEIINKI